MAINKVYIGLTDDMLKRVDMIAEIYGVSRSAYLAMIIGQNVTATEKTFESIPEFVSKVVSESGEVAAEEVKISPRKKK